MYIYIYTFVWLVSEAFFVENTLIVIPVIDLIEMFIGSGDGLLPDDTKPLSKVLNQCWQITSKALKYTFHYSDITCMLWHLISLATWLFVQQFDQANKKIIVPHDMPLVSGIHQWLVDSSHRSTVMLKRVSIIMIFSSFQWPNCVEIFFSYKHNFQPNEHVLITVWPDALTTLKTVN